MASESFSDVVWADIGVTSTTGAHISGLDAILRLVCIRGAIELLGISFLTTCGHSRRAIKVAEIRRLRAALAEGSMIVTKFFTSAGEIPGG